MLHGVAHTIRPLTQSVEHLFAAMLKLPVSAGRPRDGRIPFESPQVRGLVRIVGTLRGSMTLVLPEPTAASMIVAFMGRLPAFGGCEYRDAVGELANMVAGGAAARFGGGMLEISCPCVSVGIAEAAMEKPAAGLVAVPFLTTAGPFAVEVEMGEAGGAAKAA